MTSRKHPTAGFWITVALIAVLVAYPLSFGPACWITSRVNAETSALPVVYRPLTWAMSRSPGISRAMTRYAGLGAVDGWIWCRVGQNDFYWMELRHFAPLPN